MSRDELLKRALRLIESAAQTCEGWAVQSAEGGWSTHQVSGNRELASACRELLDQSQKVEGT